MVNFAFVSGLVSFIVFLGHEVFSRPVTGMFFLMFLREIFNSVPLIQIAIYLFHMVECREHTYSPLTMVGKGHRTSQKLLPWLTYC